MERFPVAVQLYSVRDAMAQDVEGTLRKLRAMGYDGVEPAGLFGRTAVAFMQLLGEIGLQMPCAHVGLADLESDAVLDDFAAAGLRYIALPYLENPGTADELAGNIARIRSIAERCKARGLQMLYHNHAFEFEKLGGKSILDHYFEQIPAELLQTEQDTCWVNVGGENPAAYLRKYAGRAPMLHLKDFVGGRPGEAPFEDRPLGLGCEDVPELVAAARDAGSLWLITEMDDPALGKSSLECAEMSIQYLKTIL